MIKKMVISLIVSVLLVGSCGAGQLAPNLQPEKKGIVENFYDMMALLEEMQEAKEKVIYYECKDKSTTSQRIFCQISKLYASRKLTTIMKSLVEDVVFGSDEERDRAGRDFAELKRIIEAAGGSSGYDDRIVVLRYEEYLRTEYNE